MAWQFVLCPTMRRFVLFLFALLAFGLSASAQNPATAPPPGTPSLDAYRDTLRRLFVTRDYSQLLELTNEIEKYYPRQSIVAYYRNESSRRLEEKKEDKRKPFASLRDQPIVLKATPSPTPIATPARQIAMAVPPPRRATPSRPDAPPPATSADEPTPAPTPSPTQRDFQNVGLIAGGIVAAALLMTAIALLIRNRKGGHEVASTQAPAPPPPLKPRTFAPETPLVRPVFSEPAPPKAAEPPPREDFAPVAKAPHPAGPPRSIVAPPATEEPASAKTRSPIDLEEWTRPVPPAPRAEELTDLPSFADETPIPIERITETTGRVEVSHTDTPAPWDSKSATETDIPMLAEPPAPPEPEIFRHNDPGYSAGATGGLPLDEIPDPEGADTDAATLRPPKGLKISELDTQFEIEGLGTVGEQTKTSYDLSAAGRSAESESGVTGGGAGSTPGDAGGGVQVFHQDETVQLHLEDTMGAESRPMIPISPETPRVDTQTSPSYETSGGGHPDPFEKEQQFGMLAFKEARWDQAVHHLSIAAALRPEALDVKEHLRRARRMRKEGGS